MKYPLKHHPETPPAVVLSLEAAAQFSAAGDLCLHYVLRGDLGQLSIPEPLPPIHKDGLWEYTCFEVFVRVVGNKAYREFNFSPSGQWAAYAFSDYRQRTEWVASQSPEVKVVISSRALELDACIAAADLPGSQKELLQLGLTAVVESASGGKTYWALHHPAQHPDFHHHQGFIYEVRT